MPNGIASCAPIITGETKVASFNAKFINKKTPVHIDNENPNNGNRYFLSGILNFQKGIRQIKTIPILKAPINIGGTFEFNISLDTGYVVPKSNIINKTRKRCLVCI